MPPPKTKTKNGFTKKVSQKFQILGGGQIFFGRNPNQSCIFLGGSSLTLMAQIALIYLILLVALIVLVALIALTALTSLIALIALIALL